MIRILLKIVYSTTLLIIIVSCNSTNTVFETNKLMQYRVEEIHNELNNLVNDFDYSNYNFKSTLHEFQKRSKRIKSLINNDQLSKEDISDFKDYINKNEFRKISQSDKLIKFLEILSPNSKSFTNLNTFLCFELNYLISLNDHVDNDVFFKFDKLEAVIVPTTEDRIRIGQNYSANIFIAGTQSNIKNSVSIFDSTFSDNLDKLIIQEDYATFNMITSQKGKHKFCGYYDVWKNKSYVQYPFCLEYFVE